MTISAMPILSEKNIAEEVQHWVEAVVIGLNLCPFAQKELKRDSVRFCVSAASSELELLQHLSDELDLLLQDDSIETTLLIHPSVLENFSHYNQFLSIADELLRDSNLEGSFQIASFHPQYQFEGTLAEVAENYSNRSPYPMLHLLRETSVEKAVASYDDVTAIPARNIERLRALGVAEIKALSTKDENKARK